jgi:hypothetical protein
VGSSEPIVDALDGCADMACAVSQLEALPLSPLSDVPLVSLMISCLDGDTPVDFCHHRGLETGLAPRPDLLLAALDDPFAIHEGEGICVVPGGRRDVIAAWAAGELDCQ